MTTIGNTAAGGALALSLLVSGGAAASGVDARVKAPGGAVTLAGSEWRPTEIGGVAVPSGLDSFVRFEAAGKLVGRGGCNRFFGSYAIAGVSIQIGPLGATRMACPDPESAYEDRLLRVLGEARTFSRERLDLVLGDASGKPLVRFVQTDAD